MREFEQEVQAPFAPGLVRAATAPLAWLATRHGLTRRYQAPPIQYPARASKPSATRPGQSRASAARPTPARPSTPRER
jgi:hypothetical protein